MEDKYKICASCAYFSIKIYIGLYAEGKCFVDYPSELAWVKGHDSCDRHERESDECIDSIVEKYVDFILEKLGENPDST